MSDHSLPPKVTVLMTLYNKGEFVGETVESILNNTFSDLELLVVDDASTDNGLEVVRSFNDPRIRILTSTKNTGRAAAANRGYDAATGEYIAVVDADDLVDPERFQKQVVFMDANPDIGALGSAIQGFGANDSLFRWKEDDTYNRGRLLFGLPVSYPAAMIRRSILEAHHIRCNENWKIPGMDYLFFLSMAPHMRFANLPEALIKYRMGEQNMRHGRNAITDRIELDKEVFRMVGFPITKEQLALHVYLSEGDPAGLSASKVPELWKWVNDLKQLNQSKGVFPEPVFSEELDRRWHRLFNLLADQDAAAALAHSRCSSTVSLGKIAHIGKRVVRRISGDK